MSLGDTLGEKKYTVKDVPPAHEYMREDAGYIDGILGPHEVGVMMAIFLFGLVTIQVFTYFHNYPGDSSGTKCLVGFVWLLLLAQTFIGSFSLYRRTVTDYGLGNDLERFPDGLCGAFAVTGLIGSTVQSFFAFRLRKLSGRSAISMGCWGLSAIRVGSSLCISVTTCQARTVHEYADRWAWIVILSLSISAFVDLVIAGSLSYYLWIQRQDVFKHARRVVDKLIAWSIQTGALTSIMSILMLILYAAVKNFAWIAVYLIIPGLFGNYLLASLNARHSLQSDMNQRPTFLDILTLHDHDNGQELLPPSQDIQSATMRAKNAKNKTTDIERGDLNNANT